MFSPHSNSGFYRTPVSKAVLGSVALSSFALNIPLHHYQHWFIYAYSSIVYNRQIWRLFTSKLVFLDVKDLICGAMLIYYFKIFERRYGSRKYASYLLCTMTLSTSLEMLAQAGAKAMDLPITTLPSGPYFLIFPLFIPFYFDIPRVAVTNVLGIPVTGKSFTYILGLQIASSSTESFLVAICGIVSGLLYRKNFGFIQSWFNIPEFVAKTFGSTVGRILHTPAPQNSDEPIGATLEVQRQQQMERLEQQLAWAQLQQQQPQNQARGFGLFGNQNGFAARFRQNAVPPGEQNVNPTPPIAVSEVQVQQLVEMGFSRESVLEALRASNNDIHTATTVLLQDS